MAKVHFRSYTDNKMVLFPQRIDKEIREDDPVRLLNVLVDGISLDKVYKLKKGGGKLPPPFFLLFFWVDDSGLSYYLFLTIMNINALLWFAIEFYSLQVEPRVVVIVLACRWGLYSSWLFSLERNV